MPSQRGRLFGTYAPPPGERDNKHRQLWRRRVTGCAESSWQNPADFSGKEGSKMNARLYRHLVLGTFLQPWAEKHFGNARWIFVKNPLPVTRHSQHGGGFGAMYRTLYPQRIGRPARLT
ncbi:hypothetical protein Y032_0089g2255 [Ancylostoma ceylanicum]|uniref:Uncharacterized protein n=1 Tax=Ancylostoma ceylanicum TaxID=53326 RepID=A0A016TN36_9BILA|nr:hypothetical protein Y032_0089g2255 [Ancylostoma ceylanicum]